MVTNVTVPASSRAAAGTPSAPAEPGSAQGSVPARARIAAEGNERLTAWAGGALLLGFAAEGVTILDVHWWLLEHIWIGYALFLPVGVKVASTTYRFARYYTSTPAYVEKGPPRLLLRVLGPILVLNTLFILVSGAAIMLLPDHRWRIEQLHKLSFWTWFALTAIHVLAYVWRLPGLMLADLRARGTTRGAALQRIGVVAVAGVLGLGGGALLIPWIQRWMAG